MNPKLTSDEQALLNLLPDDGRGLGNRPLLRALGWDAGRYGLTVDALLAKQIVVRGVGNGGSLKRKKESDDEAELLKFVPEKGEPVSNVMLRRKLGWHEDKYFVVRNRLLDQGILLKGPGRGGTIRREVEVPRTEKKSNSKSEAGDQPKRDFTPPVREVNYYPDIAKVLSGVWSKERGFVWSRTEVTAQQGKRETGGKWSRPDIAVISLKRFKYLPGTYLEIATFEVKVIQSLNVTAVYEALAHARAANRSYVLCVCGARSADFGDVIEAVREESVRHGIGLIIAEKADDFDTWDFVADATPQDIENERLNDFIKTQCSDELQGDLILQLRN